MELFAFSRGGKTRCSALPIIAFRQSRLSSNRRFGGPALNAAVAYELPCNVRVRRPNH